MNHSPLVSCAASPASCAASDRAARCALRRHPRSRALEVVSRRADANGVGARLEAVARKSVATLRIADNTLTVIVEPDTLGADETPSIGPSACEETMPVRAADACAAVRRTRRRPELPVKCRGNREDVRSIHHAPPVGRPTYEPQTPTVQGPALALSRFVGQAVPRRGFGAAGQSHIIPAFGKLVPAAWRM